MVEARSYSDVQIDPHTWVKWRNTNRTTAPAESGAGGPHSTPPDILDVISG